MLRLMVVTPARHVGAPHGGVGDSSSNSQGAEVMGAAALARRGAVAPPVASHTRRSLIYFHYILPHGLCRFLIKYIASKLFI